MEERVLYNNGEVLTFLDKPVSFDTYLTKAIWKSYPDYINGSMLREERRGGGWFSSPSYTYWLSASNGEETAISRRRYDELSQRVIDQVASAEKKTIAILSKYEHELELRVLLSYQDEFFPKEQIEKFFSSSYIISNEFNRMGCKLSGEKIQSSLDGTLYLQLYTENLSSRDATGHKLIQVKDFFAPHFRIHFTNTSGGSNETNLDIWAIY